MESMDYEICSSFISALVGGFVLTLAAGAHAQSTTKQYATIVRIEGRRSIPPATTCGIR